MAGDPLMLPEQSQEPFPCPACGQMLAPSVRVCVACKQPIDPSQIKRPESALATIQPRATLPTAGRAQFSWRMFFVVLVIWLPAAKGAQTLLGVARAQLALGAVQIFSSIWVLFDAGARRVPKPLRWALGSLLLWVIVFPWYLARRRTPQLPCQFVEGEAGPWARTLFFILVAIFLLGAIILILQGQPR